MYVTGTVSGQGPTPANSGRLVRSVFIGQSFWISDFQELMMSLRQNRRPGHDPVLFVNDFLQMSFANDSLP